MIRGILALLSMSLFIVGIAVTFATLTVDGWTVLAALGFAGIYLDVEWEARHG